MKKLILIGISAAVVTAIPSLANGQGKGQEKGGGKPAAAKAERPGKGALKQGRGKSSDKRPARVVRGLGEDAGRSANSRGVDGRLGPPNSRGVGSVCPPGLAKKNNGCLPPGQAKKLAVGPQLSSRSLGGYDVPKNYRGLYGNMPDYRYDGNGDIYRVDRTTNRVTSRIPLLGGSFAAGQELPRGYDVYNVPRQYRSAFQDSEKAHYRYGDNAIYQVDPRTQRITGVAALLAKDNLSVGGKLPAGYDSYNLPLQFRSQYRDTDQNLYRYANGNIYEVDAKTRSIKSMFSAPI